MEFIALNVSLSLIEKLREPMKRIKRGNKGLADQLMRATVSVASNVSEGRGREGADRHHFWVIAYSSAKEAKTQILIARGSGFFTEAEAEDVYATIDQLCALTYGLKRTKN